MAPPLHISGAGLAARRVGAEAAPVAALFFLEHCAHGSVYGGPCWEGETPAGTYSRSANPARSATPTLGGVGGRFETCRVGAFSWLVPSLRPRRAPFTCR